MFSRVLFPTLMEAGAGKQNAVVMIVVRRYAGPVVVAGPGLLSSSIATMMVDRLFTSENRADVMGCSPHRSFFLNAAILSLRP